MFLLGYGVLCGWIWGNAIVGVGILFNRRAGTVLEDWMGHMVDCSLQLRTYNMNFL